MDSPCSTPLRVLIVDDEHAIADSLAMILRARGCTPRVAYSGEEAIGIAEEFDPHALISDVVMPGISGVELAVWFADHRPDCKVLLISGNQAAFPLVEDSVRQGNFHTILPKPVHPTHILEFLDSCAAEPESPHSMRRPHTQADA